MMMQFNVLKLLLTQLKILNYLKANIDQATQSVQNAEQALHGAEKLNQDKQTSSTELDGLTDLTDAQREKLREQINTSNSRDDIKQKLSKQKH